MSPRTFREVDHSGDVGVEAWGGTLAELFEHMTRGLLGLLSRKPARRAVSHDINIVANGDGDLLVDWLSEVIAATQSLGVTFGDVEVSAVAGGRATGILHGEPTDPARHDLRFDVKAATYHNLLFERSESTYHARVIFDL